MQGRFGVARERQIASAASRPPRLEIVSYHRAKKDWKDK
jgi:hypothetical protein